MKHLFVLITLLTLAGTLTGLQAGNAPQTAPGAPAGKTAEQKKADESECIKWAKQQAGLGQPDAQQPAATGGAEKAGAAPANQGGVPATQGAAAKPADNAGQSSSSSAITGAASQLGLGGAMNPKVTQLVKDAYAQCMQKKGHKVK